MKKNIQLIVGTAMFTLFCVQTQAQEAQKSRLPAARTSAERKLGQERNQAIDPFSSILGKTGGIQMPDNVRYPGEFEESQAVVISWSAYTNSQEVATRVDTNSIDGYISAQLAKYLSDELPVWIRVPQAVDTVAVKTFMTSLGWPLTHNYRFLITSGNSWWMRDFGPNGIYYSTADSVGFMDLKYYDGRDLDDVFPVYLAGQLGYKNIMTKKLYGEGGNLMSDGFGKVFFSDMFVEANGTYGLHNPEWTEAQTLDSVKNVFNASGLVKLPKLQCDGGTGHIDLYVKLLDEQTLLVGSYNQKVQAADRQIVEDNYQYMTTLKSVYNRPYRIIRVTEPTRDNGFYTDSTCDQLDFDARTFINGITANKTFIYPSYSDDIDGNQAQTTEITNYFKSFMPGYKVIPIDSRSITTNGGGGAIHCITMQIPVENPVLFWHPSVDGTQPKVSSYHILSKITNHSGIASAVCKWRILGSTSWNNVNLTDSSGYFIGDITPGTLSNNDRIEYYLTATTNNGKTAVKPITAPDGYYTIRFQNFTAAEQVNMVTEKNYLFGAYPNPAANSVTIPFHLTGKADVQIVLTDLMGKEVLNISKAHLAQGTYNETVDVAGLSNGIYFYSLLLNGEKLSTRKLMIRQ